MKYFAKSSGSIIALTEAIDLVADSSRCFVIINGRPEMGRITSIGCQLSVIMTDFVTAKSDVKLKAYAASVCMMGLAEEIAFTRLNEGEGNSTSRNKIIEAIYNMNSKTLDEGYISTL